MSQQWIRLCLMVCFVCSIPLSYSATRVERIKQATKAGDRESLLVLEQELDELFASAPEQASDVRVEYATVKLHLGYFDIKRRDYTQSVSRFEQAVQMTADIPSWQKQAYSGLSQCYSYWAMDDETNNDVEQALYHSLQTVEYALKAQKFDRIIRQYIVVGRLYGRLRMFSEAEEALSAAYNINERLHNDHYTANRAGITYTRGKNKEKEEDYQVAITLLEEAFDLYQATTDQNREGNMLSAAQALYDIYTFHLYNPEKADAWSKTLTTLKGKYQADEQIRHSELVQRVARLHEILQIQIAGNYDEAISRYKQLIEQLRTTQPVDQTSIAECYYHCGLCYLQKEDYPAAIDNMTAGVTIMQQLPLRPMLVDGLRHLSTAYFYNHQLPNAVQAAQQAVDYAKQLYDQDSKTLAQEYMNLANLQAFDGNFAQAKTNLMQVKHILAANIRKTFSYLTAQERESYWQAVQNNLLNMQAFLMKMQDTQSEYTDALYDIQLLCKGLLLQSEIELQRIAERNKDLQPLITELTSLKREIANEKLTPDSIRSLKRKAEDIEQQLLAKSREIGDYLQFLQINNRDVRQALPANAVAIEFGTFRYGKDSLMTVAYVMNRDWEHVRLIPLFEQRQFDSIHPKQIYSSPEAYELIWQPILAAIGAVDAIYFTPSGCLYNTAIEYLSDEDGRCISDNLQLVRLSSTRRLVRAENSHAADKAVLFGGLNYAPNSNWKYLNASLQEVNTISHIISHAQVYASAAGTEQAFEQLSGNGWHIIHLATHGFALPVPADEQKDLHSGLRYCGLVLSGAGSISRTEYIPNRQDDILTAQEITLMDLSGCKMAVLSACQTALGVISSDGVLGLQRAFKIAGVESLIMSLWTVHDDATQLLMTEFYRNWITLHQPKRTAFRNAQNTVRKKFPEPTYWAGFVMLD